MQDNCIQLEMRGLSIIRFSARSCLRVPGLGISAKGEAGNVARGFRRHCGISLVGLVLVSVR